MKPADLVEKLLSENNQALIDLVKSWTEGRADRKQVFAELQRQGVITQEDFARYGADGIEVEPGSREHGVIHVFLTPQNLQGGEIITVNQDGTTDRVDNK